MKECEHGYYTTFEDEYCKEKEVWVSTTISFDKDRCKCVDCGELLQYSY
jgi:hypothetical protein